MQNQALQGLLKLQNKSHFFTCNHSTSKLHYYFTTLGFYAHRIIVKELFIREIVILRVICTSDYSIKFTSRPFIALLRHL